MIFFFDFTSSHFYKFVPVFGDFALFFCSAQNTSIENICLYILLSDIIREKLLYKMYFSI